MLATAQGALALSRVRPIGPTFVVMSTSVVPVGVTSACGVPVSACRFGVAVGSAGLPRAARPLRRRLRPPRGALELALQPPLGGLAPLLVARHGWYSSRRTAAGGRPGAPAPRWSKP